LGEINQVLVAHPQGCAQLFDRGGLLDHLEHQLVVRRRAEYLVSNVTKPSVAFTIKREYNEINVGVIPSDTG
jgi:regulator of sirC expression with transglutaminase-like and TPR domain